MTALIVDQVADIQAAIAQTHGTLPQHSLSPREVQLVELLCRDGGWLPYATMVVAIWGQTTWFDPELRQYGRNSLRTLVWLVRRKLAGTGWEIQTSRDRDGGGFHRITRAD